MEGEQVQGDGGEAHNQGSVEQTVDKGVESIESDEKGLIGRQLKKADGTLGEVTGFDSESKLCKVSFGEDHTEDMTLEDAKSCLLPEITFKRFRQKRKDPTPEEESLRADTRSEGSEDDSSESSEGEEDTEHAVSLDEAGTTDGEAVMELTADETEDQREDTPPPPLENGNAVDDSDGGTADGLDDSDSSLDESDIEMLTRKRRKKKRKHVLTLQRWRGYRKKRKAKEINKLALLPVDNPDDAEKSQRMVDAMEEAAPRKKSRTRKLAEVDEIQRKRQKIASELKNKLKSCKKSSALVKLKENDEEQPLMTEASLAQEFAEPKPSPFDRGIKLRGRKLKKVFKGKVTRGEIADYCRRSRNYQVRYEDGEVEKLMWKDVKTMLVPFEQMQTWDDPDDNDTLLSVYRESAKEKAVKLKPLPL